MIDVERSETLWRITNTARSIFYSLVPVLAVSTIWAIGWARSLESEIPSDKIGAAIISSGYIQTRDGPRKLKITVENGQTAIAVTDQN